MYLKSVIFLLSAIVVFCFAKDCPNAKRINSKLICYYSKTIEVDSCYCTHVVLPANTNVKEIENLRRKLTGVKILLTVNEFNQGLVKTVKQNNIDGLELNLKKLSSKEDITDFISTVRTKFGNDLFLALSIPPRTELLAKYYDLKALTKKTDLFILQTTFLGASKNVTFHPSRLSGLWDMQNTDSVVDLVTGLGAPLSRLAVTAPVQAFQFRLQDSGMTTPGSPALELKTINRKELCRRMNSDNVQSWTLERDQDQAGPYIFRGKEWIAFEDPTSMDIKAKYTRVRGLAGLALKDLSQDIATSDNEDSTACSSLLAAAHAGLSKQNRAPRGAVLRSLEREILVTPGVGHPLEKVNVSPFRITRVVDVEGHFHSIRKDTRTEFTCSRQGYFVHPQSCGRFYRCVKFDQLTDDFSVFEFDCPAGLAFDERVEVCVWPGSLPHGAPCQGSSEIAPVPRGRFNCPSQPGYYADPENCRWFFACLDHGQSAMTAYEFRCPFGLVFDEQHLLCQWPWLVPSCKNGYTTGLDLDSVTFYGGAAKSTLIAGGQNIQLSSGARVLDSYDGLGALGTVALGGYQGDINILKNNLHGLSNGHVIQGVGLVSGDEQYLTSQGLGGGAQNLQQLSVGSKLSNGAGQGLGATSYSNFEGGNIGSSGHLGLVQTANFGSQGLVNENIRLGQSSGQSSTIQHGQLQSANIGLNLGQNIGSEGHIQQNIGSHGLVNENIGLSGQSIQHGLLQSANIGLNLGQNLGSEGHVQQNIGSHGLVNTNIGLGLSSGQSIQHGLLQSGNIGLNLGQNIASEGHIQQNIGSHGLVNENIGLGLSSGQSIQHGLLQSANIGLNLGSEGHIQQNIGSHGLANENIGLGLSSGQSSIIQHGLLQSDNIGLNLGQNIGSAGQIGLVQHGLSNENIGLGHSTSIQHGLSGSEINLGLLDEGNRQETLLNSGGFGEKLTSGDYQSNSGQAGLTLLEGINSGGASSSVEFNNYNRGSQGIINGLNSGQNAELILAQAPATVNSLNHGSEQTTLLLNTNRQDNSQSIGSKASSFQTIHQSTPQSQITVVPVQSTKQLGRTHSGTLNYHNQYANEAKYVEQPIISQIPSVEYGTKLTHNIGLAQGNLYSSVQKPTRLNVVNYASNYLGVTPKTEIFNLKSPTIQYQTPVVQSDGAQSNSYSQINHYLSPAVQIEQKVQTVQPVVYEQKVQSIQPVVLKTQSQSGAQSNSYSQINHYQSPAVQIEQKVQPVVYEQNVQTVQPVVYEQKVQSIQPVVLKTQSQSGAQSNSYSQINHYQSPAVQIEQKVQPVVYEQNVQTVQPVVYEQKVQAIQPVVLKAQSQSGAQSNSYSQINHYQSPAVQIEQKVQPVVYEQNVQTVQPVVYEQKVQQPIVYEQKVQPVVYEQKVQTVQPVVYEQRVQPVQQLKYKTNSARINSQSQSYSQINHYQSPAVQIEQKVQQIQPVVYEQKVQQPIVYEQRVQPVQVTYQTESTRIKSPSQSYSQINNYQSPVVQIKQRVQPVVYEQKVQQIQPVVQRVQPIVYEQRVQPVQQLTYQTESARVKSPSQSYSQINHAVQNVQQIQPVVYEQKVQPVQQVTYQTESSRIKSPSQSYSQINHGVQIEQNVQQIQPVVYEQKVQQPIVYEQNVQQPLVQQHIQYKSPIVQQEIVQPIVVTTPRYEKIVPVVHYERKVQPIIQQNLVTVTPKYETQYYGQRLQEINIPAVETVSVTPKYQQINIPVVKQPAAFVSKVNIPIETASHSYSTIRHHISAPKVEAIAVTPQYYAQPIQKIQPVTYESRVPVVEPKVVQKFVQPLTYLQPETPQINTYLPAKSTYISSTPRPIINNYYVTSTQKPQVYVQPKQIFVSSTPKYSVFQEYVQPKQTFEIRKTVQPITYQKAVPPTPSVVESYSYLPTVQKKPVQFRPRTYLPAKLPEVYVSTTPTYSVFQEYVQPKQTFEIKKTVNPTVISEYQYENPEFAHYGSNLNFNSAQDLSYLPAKLPDTVYYSTQRPVISTIRTVPIKSHRTDYIISTPKPTFVSTIAPIIKQTPTIRTKVVAINKYETLDNRYLVSTPKPIYVSTPAPILTKTDSLGEFKYYDSRFDTSTGKVDLYNQFGNNDYVDLTSRVVTSTVRPIQRKKIVATTQIPIDNYQEYYDDRFDSQYIVSSKPTIATTYRPQIQNYVSTTDNNLGYVITAKPTYRPVQRKKIVNYDNNYVITTLRPQIVTTTLRPIVKKKKIVTTSLPDYDDYYVSSVRPESIKITPRPKGKTIVRVNDFHPFLTTKLGAQCTCTSNTLKLRNSKQQTDLPDNVPVTKLTSAGPASYDDYNEPGVYVVGNSDADYEYEPQKVVSVTRTPDILIKTTTNAVQPAPTPVYTIRRKSTTVAEPEIILSSTPASRVVDEVFLRDSKERKIAQAVNEGLSLVKSAIKGYVKDAVQDEVRNFDRYGPGGWRSRGETLQGSVDCQRAGLFRHPTQCNKFYACHWDCTKQRYTLHVFNCPIHLTFDTTQGACNWPSKGPACTDNTLLPTA